MPETCDQIDDMAPRKMLFPVTQISMKDQIIQNSYSLKLFEHLGQIVSRKEFAFFDFDNSEWNQR